VLQQLHHKHFDLCKKEVTFIAKYSHLDYALGVVKKIDKNKYGFSTIEIVIAIVVLFLIVFVGAGLYFHVTSNKAKQQSSFIQGYAKSQGMVQIGTNGDSGKGLDNSIPWYEMYYKTTQSETQVKNSFTNLLQSNGYKVSTNLFDPKSCFSISTPTSNGMLYPEICHPSMTAEDGLSLNNFKPYWVIFGTTSKYDVKAEITDISYYNEDINAYNNNLYKNEQGEHPVPSGDVVINVGFSLIENGNSELGSNL